VILEEIASIFIYFFPIYVFIMNYFLYRSHLVNIDKIFEKFLLIFSTFSIGFVIWNMYSKYVFFLYQWGMINIIMWIVFLVSSYYIFGKLMIGSDKYVAGICFTLFATEWWEIPIHIQTVLAGGYDQLILTFILSSPYIILIIPVISILKRYKEGHTSSAILLMCMSYLIICGAVTLYYGSMNIFYDDTIRYILRGLCIYLFLSVIWVGCKSTKNIKR